MSIFTLLTIVAIIASMIALTALYVAAEFATVAARKTRISQLAAEGDKQAQRLRPFIENSQLLDRYIAACQLGITLASLILGAYGQNVLAQRLNEPLRQLLPAGGQMAAESISFGVVLAFITLLQVILGELLPKSFAVQYPEQVALWASRPMRWSLFLFSPLVWFFNGSSNLLLGFLVRLGLLGFHPNDKKTAVHSPEEIELLVTESHEGGLLEDSERQLLRNAFRLRELTARQVMLHRTRLIAAPLESTVSELIDQAIDAGFSRIPLYRDTIDDVVGFVHVKDLFRLKVQNNESVQSIIREVVYVPETLPAADVWGVLNKKRKYLAIVFDEYGGTAGLITFEDLIEEIFGELQDEFDDEMALVARDKEGRIYLRGDLLVTDVNEYLDLNLPTDADTLSGLVFSELGRAPAVGDTLVMNDIVISIQAMEDLGVAEVSLQLPQINDLTTLSDWEVEDHE